ncbi:MULTISPECIES: carbamoyltransferase HypF [unclassified Dehalobacter]|uniref:carbamoyltransferase HypF n=1 Tax=unclassified Dehalobacter TaxID=2635733 RepID=UPI000E6BC2F9|nr:MULTISPECIES: carbamoyltransferase HypF [unclassified Dehalobacter]RJE46785.1 carbamoyltransferase HypF [Dehalobacter sp. MCB1]TCX49255.1 carbamoyltransferase HypF [Dehalobacter sp. 14DCB1]TCX49835.1 carbamoyltransferase HypF [Dehalobacter sp. 12DCB1]
MIRAVKILINGIVQGVGFRPFIFKLARELDIKGWVNNFSGGVEIQAEGERVEEFICRIRTDQPALAAIVSLEITEIPVQHYREFTITESRESEDKDVLISPDVAVCRDCLQEMFHSKDRRYLYPFINCTNCGPRYTIIKDRPYDREKTTMAGFQMCPECHQEYMDPLDRRFHAQPTACAVCGPALQLLDHTGNEVSGHGIGFDLLQEGAILAVKGLGGFHLVCDACNHEAVSRLRRVKERGAKPFAVMARNIETALQEVTMTELEKSTLAGPSAPIVLLPRKKNGNSRISPQTAPGLQTLGIMLPYAPVHHLLFQGTYDYLVMTSANLSGQPLIYDNQEALAGLSGIADYFLLNNRDIYHPCDDSVMQMIGDQMTFIRRARGYVPLPLFLKQEIKTPIVGLGGEMKNAFCLASGKMAFVSQYIGDMHGYENLERFEQEFYSFQKVTNIIPQKTAYDMHPEYSTTRIARSMDCPKFRVQHHHAHLASVMAEHGMDDPMLGLICDGTGYGEDGRIWGFEYLFGNQEGYERKAHLEYLPLPGGDAGAKYPLRIAYAYLKKLMTQEEWQRTEPLWAKLSSQEKNILDGQLRSGFQLFETSSAGRLFDAVSGILGVCTEVTYEGQAAIELESAAEKWLEDGNTGIQKELNEFPIIRLQASMRVKALAALLDQHGISGQTSAEERLKLIEKYNEIADRTDGSLCPDLYPALYPACLEISGEPQSSVLHVKVGSLLKDIANDVLLQKNPGEAALRFHYSLACQMLETAMLIGLKNKKLPIAGGVFQNKLLTEILLFLAGEIGVEILCPQKLPSGDGGLAFGQVLIANAAIEEKPVLLG